MSTETPASYAGTTGWSGSTTSHDRAHRETHDGTATSRTAIIQRLIVRAGYKGLTAQQIAKRTGWTHGQVSSPLTHLHMTGRVARLAEVRAGQQPYVRPDKIAGRDTEPYRRNVKIAELQARVEELEGLLAEATR